MSARTKSQNKLIKKIMKFLPDNPKAQGIGLFATDNWVYLFDLPSEYHRKALKIGMEQIEDSKTKNDFRWCVPKREFI